MRTPSNPYHRSRLVLGCVLIAASCAVVACGDDAAVESDDANASASTNNASTGTNNASTGSNNGGTGTTSANNGTTSANNASTVTNNASTGPTSGNNGTTSTNGGTVFCPDGALIFLAPSDGAQIAPGDDVDPEEPGLQIDVRIATTLPPGAIVSVESLEARFGAGALVSGPEVTLEGVTLAPGTNTLVATGDDADCLATATIVIGADTGQACADDAQCPDGEQCGEGGICAPCAEACTEDADCGPNGTCVRGCACTFPYSAVLVEDTSGSTSGTSPGADLDAIGLDKDGTVYHATHVLDANIGGGEGNEWDDPNAILGAPDSDCSLQNFVSLGGAPNGGYIMVDFHTDQGDVFIEEGDAIFVYELGPTFCTNRPNWNDETYAVSVSVSDDRANFVEIGAGGPGNNRIPVVRLP